MKRWFGLMTVLLGLMALTGCGEQYQWKQKVTVTVETPTGTVSGSSINKISWTKNDALGAANGAAWRYGPRGEAVVVPIDSGRYLFALTMKDEYAGNIVGQLLFKQDGRVWGADKFKGIQAHKGALGVPFSRAPMLVTFDDINDPKTVQLVDPANLAATFGEGYALKSISVEITDETVSEGAVERVLGWLDKYYDTHLDNNKLESADAINRLANSLSAGSFDTVKSK